MEFDYIDLTWDDIGRSYRGMRRAEGDMPGRGSGGGGQSVRQCEGGPASPRGGSVGAER